MKHTYKYKFSIVIAIYNTEDYIEEAILSTVNQTIGFEENVQLILVNDGSTDNSKFICEKYKQIFPKNIIYLEKENGGVSSARNEGMKHIQGKYMNFLDSDDKLSIDTLVKVYRYFESIYELTDIVSIPVYYFEGKTGQHILNYKYKITRCIDLHKEYKNIQLFINSAFIKSEYKDIFKFDKNMKYAEDAEIINKILLNKFTLGVVSDVVYWYRVRKNNSSAIQTGNYKKEWYLDYMRSFSLKLIQYSMKEKGNIPKFMQYTIMYDLQWRINCFKYTKKILDKDDFRDYYNLLIYIISNIGIKIIFQQKSIKLYKKFLLLFLKINYYIKISTLR